MFGRGLYGCVFEKVVLLGYFNGIFLGRVNWCEFGSSDGFLWEILNRNQMGNLEEVLIRYCDGEVLGLSYGVLVKRL